MRREKSRNKEKEKKKKGKVEDFYEQISFLN
jgi:hypothetical protein